MQQDISIFSRASGAQWDWWLLVLLAGAGFLYAFTFGKRRGILSLLSLYIAAFITGQAPFLYSWATGAVKPYAELIAFGILWMVLSVFFARGVLGRNVYDFTFSSQIEVVLFSFLQLGLLVVIIGLFAPPTLVAYFTPATQTVFTHEYARVLWMLAPLAFVALAP